MGLAEDRIQHGIYFASVYPRLITKNARSFQNVLILQRYCRRNRKGNTASEHSPQKLM